MHHNQVFINLLAFLIKKKRKPFKTSSESNISKTNYFKYSKEILGSINIARKYVDGIVFLSSFPCSLDAISNELAILKCDLPCINIIIDDINSITGIDSRIESFCDIIERKKVC